VIQQYREHGPGASTPTGRSYGRARNGLTSRDGRHAFLALPCGEVTHLSHGVNKWTWSATNSEVFERIVEEFSGLRRKLDISDLEFIRSRPLHGDDKVYARRPTCSGTTAALLNHLEAVNIAVGSNLIGRAVPGSSSDRTTSARRPRLHDYRGITPARSPGA